MQSEKTYEIGFDCDLFYCKQSKILPDSEGFMLAGELLTCEGEASLIKPTLYLLESGQELTFTQEQIRILEDYITDYIGENEDEDEDEGNRLPRPESDFYFYNLQNS